MSVHVAVRQNTTRQRTEVLKANASLGSMLWYFGPLLLGMWVLWRLGA